ncbi:MAG: hypothetical protein PHH83_04735 [Patescibacteria group bacterium]|nr:hypothetical protein [Patescibacteria group bacterium]
MILNFLRDINENYANTIQALTPFIIGIVSFAYYKIYQESKIKNGDAANIVSSKFVNWWWQKYKILAVHQYEKSDDVSGYRHLGQNSREDQYNKLIKIKKSGFLGIKKLFLKIRIIF